MPYTPPRVKSAKLTGKALEESIARRERHEKDIDFYETHREELLKKYPDQWVTILNQKVMGAADSPAELRELFKAKGIPTNRMVLRHLSTKPRILVVPAI